MHQRAPSAEDQRSYISGRIERLQKRKRLINWSGVALFAAVLLSAAVGQLAVLPALALLICAWLIASTARAQCDMFIDGLHHHWRELDRDYAMELEGFETPIP